MARLDDQNAQSRGLISLFVRHPTASNLLMIGLILIGLFSAQRLNTQFFPTIEIPLITVSVSWPGASAEDVEKNIVDAIEPELRFLDGIEDVTSIAREGSGVISLEFVSSADMQKAQSDVEQAVARITTLPDDSEEPKISRATFYESVAKISVSGPFSEAFLKSYAKTLRDGLLDAGIDRVTLSGARDEEIWVEIPERELQRLDLTLGDVALRIRDSTRDVPSGVIKGDVEVQVRSFSDRKTPETIADIEVKSLTTGEKIFLKDIASVRTRFDDDESVGVKEGRQAIELNVQRAVSADTLATMEKLNTHLATARQTLPTTLSVDAYDVRGKFVQQRLGILVKNGLQGLVLVLIVLFLFLDYRIAFWTAAGIPVALLATLAVMYASGQTINMVSMFALIMMLGIIVDDAIVVGEHTATRQELGDPPDLAAERGASRMLKPVLAATLTTQAAFFPIFLIGGRMGDIMSAIPLVVTAVLVASLIECFLILPGHMRHGFGKAPRRPGWFRRKFDGLLNGFRDGPYRAFVGATYAWRYTTIACAIAILIVAIGLLAGGRVGFRFFPSPEPENIQALVVFGAGTPRDEQARSMAELEKALDKAEAQLLAKAARRKDKAAKSQGSSQFPPSLKTIIERVRETFDGRQQVAEETRIVENRFTTLGKSGRNQGENLAQIEVQLTPSEERSIPTKEILKAWRLMLPKVPGIERVALVGRRAGPPGRDVDVRLKDAPVATLKAAAEELKEKLSSVPGVSAIADDLPYGRPELVLELTPRGTAFGFTSQSVGTQVRNAFEGAIATRFARGDEEITVRVRRMQEAPGVQELSQIYLKSPAGIRVPLTEVVTIREKQGFSIIQRRDGLRTVGVTGDIDGEVSSTLEVIERLEAEVMPELVDNYGVRYEYKGRDEERRESFADLKAGAYLALAIIYIILAWVFESYAKPLAVMAIIPFGIVGAIFGHMVMGMHLTIISMIGLLGLSGILVNDSIILVTQVKERLANGDELREAAVGASLDRLRAVLLTSLTTIGGLLPLLFETSRQAQFLIPMAITLVFGLATATILVLVLVPALVGIGGDISRTMRGFWRFWTGSRPDVATPAE